MVTLLQLAQIVKTTLDEMKIQENMLKGSATVAEVDAQTAKIDALLQQQHELFVAYDLQDQATKEVLANG